MSNTATYEHTRDRVEHYFDRTATKTWEQLTSDAPVSGIRATVRAGRDQMREMMLAELPEDLTGFRVLDAGCGTGAMATELGMRGANVVAIDISPALIEIAKKRTPDELRGQITFLAGDMFDPQLGEFDYALAMDSMIYYGADDLGSVLAELAPRLRSGLIFTLAPKTRLLMAMWRVGKLFPRSDRSPVMVPHSYEGVAEAVADVSARLSHVGTVNCGFYHSMALRLETGGSA